MRITQGMRMSNSVRTIQANQSALEKLRLKIGSGKKILQPEDDPQGTEKGIAGRSYLAAVRGTLRTIDISQSWMEGTAASLQNLADVVNKMYVKALQAANDTLSGSERESMAVEVREALTQAVDIGNSDQNGLQLFGGFKVKGKAFTLDATTLDITYNGDGGAIRQEIEPGTDLQVNVAGSHPLFQASFGALRDLYRGLMANDTAAIRTAMGNLTQSSDQTMEQVAAIGARTRGLKTSRDRLQQFEVDIQSQLNKAENQDIPEGMVELSGIEQQYQASLASLAQSRLESLFDYLG